MSSESPNDLCHFNTVDPSIAGNAVEDDCCSDGGGWMSGHSHGAGADARTLTQVLILTGLYMVIEFVGGFWTGSLALLADAGHMLTDVGAVGLALFAAWFAQHPPSTAQKTYGYYRIEILAAFVNGLLLVALSGFVFFEAIQRFSHPHAVKGGVMMLIAVGGIIINLASAYILHKQASHNLNVRAAFLHVLSDTLGSVGAVLAGLFIWKFHWYWADGIFSMLIASLVLFSAVRLILDATHVLLEGSPPHLDVKSIEATLASFEQVKAVHDLHVWTIASGRESMSVHVEVASEQDFHPNTLHLLQRELIEAFGLYHVTIQLEPPDFEDLTNPSGVSIHE